MGESRFPAALEAPQGPVVLLSENLLRPALEASRKSPRKRVILPFHKQHDDTLHRMMNVMQPGTYVRPHRHSDPPKAESIVLLRGGLWCLFFNPEGRIEGAYHLTPGLGEFGVDIEPGVFHTFVVTEPDTVIFEVKPGPYQKTSDKDFALWAPAEGDPAVPAYQERLMAEIEACENTSNLK